MKVKVLKRIMLGLQIKKYLFTYYNDCFLFNTSLKWKLHVLISNSKVIISELLNLGTLQ